MEIAFGHNPNAADLRLALIAKAQQLGYEVKDFDAEDPIYANTTVAVAKVVAAGEFDRGVLVCGTSIGVSIATNKAKGAYCAYVTDIYQAQRAMLSNNANLIAMDSQVVGVKSAEMFLEEYFEYIFDPALHSGAKIARICGSEREGQVLLSVMGMWAQISDILTPR